MKRRKIALLIVIPFFIGVLSVIFIYTGLWPNFKASLKTVPWWLWILYLPISFYVTLTLHELGHFLAFKFQGVKLRALYLTIFTFYKTEKRWHFKIYPKLWVLLGGLVVPDLDLIESEEDYERTKKAFEISLITGPIVTITFMGLTVFTFLFSFFFSTQIYWLGHLTAFTLYTTLLSTLYIVTFRLAAQGFFGDFVAYRKMKTEPIFTFVQLAQYLMFRVDQKQTTTTFMFRKAVALILQTQLRTDLFYEALMMHYLEGVVYEGEDVDANVHQIILRAPLTSHLFTENGLTYAYDVVVYLYHQNEVEKAYQLLEMIEKQQSRRLDEKLRRYLNKKTKHVIHHTYDEAFLNNEANYPKDQTWIFKPFLDMTPHIEKLHHPLPFQIYATEIKWSDIDGESDTIEQE